MQLFPARMRQYTKPLFITAFSIGLFLIGANAGAAPSAVDNKLDPDQTGFRSDEDVSPIFRNMGVVQKKAMVKSGKILFLPSMALEFSDGPFASYPINADIGVALSDFWEIYGNFSPIFVNSKRSIAKKVEELAPTSGETFSITAELPKMQYGLYFVWAPLYGKDSLGTTSIVRSDTFVRFGASMLKYTSDTGMRFHLGVGKTFFFAKWLGLRFAVSGNYTQTIVDDVKKFTPQTTIEIGPIFYLF